MLAHYAEPDQKDDNRYCCVLALDLLYPRFAAIAKNSLALYLRLQVTFVKLLVDELSEVRLIYQIRKRTALILYPTGTIVQNENVALLEVFRQTFDLVKKVHPETETDKDKEPAAALFKFIISLVCDPVNERYKHMATYDSRIFNFDKPNKYKEEVKLMRAVMAHKDAIPYRRFFAIEVLCRHQTFDDYMVAIESPPAYEKEAADMLADPFKRNEYIFTRVLLRAFVALLLDKKLMMTQFESAVQIWL